MCKVRSKTDVCWKYAQAPLHIVSYIWNFEQKRGPRTSDFVPKYRERGGGESLVNITGILCRLIS